MKTLLAILLLPFTVHATTIDLGKSGLVKNGTGLIPFTFTGPDFNLTFAPNQFVHLDGATPTGFDCLVVLETESYSLQFLSGSGYLLGQNMQPITGLVPTGSASATDGSLMALGLFPLEKSSGLLSASKSSDMNFFGVHYDLNIPSGVTVTGAEFRFFDGPFVISQVPDSGSTLLFMAIGFSLIWFWRSRLTIVAIALAAAHTSQAQLGSVSVEKKTFTSGCPAGFTCQLVDVYAPGTPMVRAIVADREPAAPLVATVSYWSGHNGESWYQGPSLNQTAITQAYFDDLSSAGVRSVQIRWCNLWSFSIFNGLPVYAIVNSCRSATLEAWIESNFGAPVQDMVGGSWGSGEVAYVLANYSNLLPQPIHTAIVHSGPVEYDIADGCEQPNGYLAYLSDSDAVDMFFQNRLGFGSGPCYQHSTSMDSIWRTNSVEYGGNYNYPNTFVHVLYGAKDSSDITRRAVAYANFLASNGQVSMDITPVVGCAHVATVCEPYMQAIESKLP